MTWDLPTLTATAVNLHQVTSLSRPDNFTLGSTPVVYSAATDVGTATCVFDVLVRRGVSTTVNGVYHLQLSDRIFDFILADDRTAESAIARPPSFTADFTSASLTVLVQTSAELPLSVRVDAAFDSEMVVDLYWCQAGRRAADEFADPANFISADVEFRMVTYMDEEDEGDGSVVAAPTFEDRGSGFTLDFGCVHVTAVAKNVQNGLRFTDLQITVNPIAERRRRLTLGPGTGVTPVIGVGARRYFPQTPSLIIVAFVDKTGSDLGITHGPQVTQEDTAPPSFINCPASPVVAQLMEGQLETTVSWVEPTAVDNVEVQSLVSTHSPGDNFTLFDSPYTVTYTASDGTQESQCTFQVRVEFNPTTAVAIARSSAAATADVTALGLLNIQRYAEPLIPDSNSTNSTIVFGAPSTIVTNLQLRILPPEGERYSLRSAPDSEGMYLYVDMALYPLGAHANRSVIDKLTASDDDVQVWYELKNFTADTTVGSSSGGDSALPSSGWLETTQVHIAPEDNLFVIRGRTAGLTTVGGAFSSLYLNVIMPLGRNISSVLDPAYSGVHTSTTLGTASTSTATTTTTTTTTTTMSTTNTLTVTTTDGEDDEDDEDDNDADDAMLDTFPLRLLPLRSVPDTSIGAAALIYDLSNIPGGEILALEDTEPPVVDDCPSGYSSGVVVLIEIDNEPGQDYGVGTWEEISAEDNRGDDNVVLTSNAPADGRYSLASGPSADPHTVTYIATDAAGNTDTCTFEVLVRDVDDPVVVPVDGPLVLDLPSTRFLASENTQLTATVVVSELYKHAAVSDNSGAYTIERPTANEELPLGNFALTLEVSDAWGNMGSAGIPVIVQDVTDPAISCPGQPTIVNMPADHVGDSIAVEFDLPEARDNDPGSLMVNATPSSGSSFAIGDSTVTVTAVDGAGNEASCNFTVRINRLEASQTSASLSSSEIGGVVGGVGALFLLLIAVFFIVLKRRSRRQPQNWDGAWLLELEQHASGFFLFVCFVRVSVFSV